MTRIFLNPHLLKDCSTCWFAAKVIMEGRPIFQCTYSGKIHTSLLGLHRSCRVRSIAVKEAALGWRDPEPPPE